MLSSINVRITPDTFEPGIFSDAELRWLADHLTEPPVSAFMDTLPPGVNRAAVEPALVRFYELRELDTHRKIAWAGTDAILDAIQAYLEWQDKTREIAKRTRGRIAHASQFHWDETGKPYKFAIGADGPQLVRTAILDDGTRQSFGVRLTGDAASAMRDITDIAPWVKSTANPELKKDDVSEHVTGAVGTATCSICGHVEQFKAGSRQTRMAALGRMSRHLKLAKTDTTRHRMLYSRKFAAR